jgi:23S rRNA (cytosine1962-C5)-methyltransferase
MKTPIWTLRSKISRRFIQGHPWVFSNELQNSPKGIRPGEWVELRDARGEFLARGFGNPNSLIAFRAVTRDCAETESSPTLWSRRVNDAWNYRKALALTRTSFRWIFGEADRIPGLILDAYRTDRGWVLVAQAHSAGADLVLDLCIEAAVTRLQKEYPGKEAQVIIRNDVSVRKKEGIPIEKPKYWKNSSPSDLGHYAVRLGPITLQADLLNGQKTGLFLDQADTIRRAIQLFLPRFEGMKTVRVLDLCTYVGQWAVQVGYALKQAGIKAEVTAVDASAQALEWAEKNGNINGVPIRTLKADVRKDLTQIDTSSYDWVICDPPAFVSSRKDLPQGRHAYMSLNTEVFRILKPGGVWISCSCSALLSEEDFMAAIDKAARRNRAWNLISAVGSQAPDHPILSNFPEGRYLKSVMGILGEKS